KPDGIVAQWYGFPQYDPHVAQAVARSIQLSFPYVLCFKSLDDKGMGGYPFLCSQQPLSRLTVDPFLAPMPERAKSDMLEWFPSNDRDATLRSVVTNQLSREFPVSKLLSDDDNLIITDDRPYNEYCYLRYHFR